MDVLKDRDRVGEDEAEKTEDFDKDGMDATRLALRCWERLLERWSCQTLGVSALE